MATTNQRLLDATIDHSVSLARYANGVVRRISALLNRTDADLFVRLTEALQSLPPEAFTVERLEQFLFSVRNLNAQAYVQLQQKMGSEIRAVVEYEASFQQSLLSRVVPTEVRATIGINEVAVEQVYSAAMARPFQGRLLSEWAQGMGEQRMLRIRDTLRQGYVQQETVGQMVSRLRGTRASGYSDGIVSIDRRNAEAVVRTAVGHTAQYTRQQVYNENRDLIKAVEWVSTLDNRTTTFCMLRDRKMYTADEAHEPIDHRLPWGGGPGAFHWNCVLGTERLSVPGGVSAIYRRTYEGKLITIQCANGRSVTITPNHPILTPVGWRAAADFNVGDELISERNPVALACLGAPQDECVQPTFNEVCEAARELFGVASVEVPMTTPDFHGDGADFEICEVWADRELRDKLNFLFPQLRHKFEFEFANLAVLESGTLTSARSLFQGRHAALASSDSIMSGSDIRELSPRPPGENRFAGVSGRNASSNTPAPEGRGARFESFADFKNPKEVACVQTDRFGPVKVVSIAVRHARVPVFNVETEKGWYAAGGIVCHNCRSTSVPVTKSWKELGLKTKEFSGVTRASMDGTVAPDTTYSSWLTRQPATRQDEILGATRGALFRRGDLPLERFANDKGRWLTLEQLRKADAGAFVRAGL